MRALAFVLLLIPSAAFAQFATEHDRREAIDHYRAGQALMSAEQFERAAERFRQAIDKDRLLTLAHYSLGQAHMALRRYASAIQAFTTCRETFRELHSLQQRERVMVERQREDEIREMKDTVRRLQGMPGGQLRVMKAESRIQDLERQRSSIGTIFQPPAEVSLALGSAYFRNESLESAEREWRAAIDVNPSMGEAHNNLAALYAMTGRKAEAEAAIKAAERAGFRVNPQLKNDVRRMSS